MIVEECLWVCRLAVRGFASLSLSGRRLIGGRYVVGVSSRSYRGVYVYVYTYLCIIMSVCC